MRRKKKSNANRAGRDKRIKDGNFFVEPEAKLLFLFLSPHAKHGPHDEPTVLEGCPARPSRTTASLSGGPSATEAAAPNDIVQLREAVWTTDCEARMAVASLDGLVGRVANALQSRPGLWDASLLIFASDNGGADNLPALRLSLVEQQWQERTVLIRKRV